VTALGKNRLRRAGFASGLCLLFAGIVLTGCRAHDFPDYPANYREFAYVTNGGSNTVSIFDVVNLRLDRELPVEMNPTGVTANPKRNEVYVVNSGTNQTNGSNGSISVIDTEKNAVAATIPVHRQPYFLEVNPAGDMAYVANSGSNSVSILDLKTRREIAVVGTGEGPGLVRSAPDGKSLVVTNRVGNSVSILGQGSGPNDWRVRKVIEGCPGATDAVILPDSTKAFVACSSGHQVMAIALARPADANSTAQPDALEALLDVGHSPVQLALKPDGGELFVSNFDSDSISEIDTSMNDVRGAYLMGSHPVHGLVSADNLLLYISNFRSQELSIYSIEDSKRLVLPLPLRVGDGPDGLAFSARGNLLFVVDARSGDVAVIRTSSRSLFTLLPTGRQPNAIAIKAFRLP
jgi:YVTN family beta-propeller protein